MIKLRLVGRRNGGIGQATCDEDCECIQGLFSFQDDFCGAPPSGLFDNEKWRNTSTFPANIFLLERTSGWWELQTQGINEIVKIDTSGFCFGLPDVAGQPLFLKQHVVMGVQNPVTAGGTYLFGLQGLSGGGSSARLLFQYEPSLGTTWRILIEDDGGLPISTSTTIPFGTDCTKPDVLKIIGTTTSVEFFINGVLVFTFPMTLTMRGSLFNIHVSLTSTNMQSIQRVNMDLVCARSGRFCRSVQI